MKRDFHDRPVRPVGIKVNLIIQPAFAQTVPLLANRPEGGVGHRQKRKILFLGDPFLLLDQRRAADLLFPGHKVDVLAVGAALTDAPLLRALIRKQIGQDDVDPLAAGQRLQQAGSRPLDQELSRDFQGGGLAQKDGNFADEAEHLLLEAGGIVDDPEMRMPRPGGDQLIVQRGSLLDRLGSRLIVRQGIILFRALGRRNQMEHGVVLVPHGHLACLQPAKHPAEFLLRHIGAVIHRRPVADDQNLIAVHGAGDFGKSPFLRLLQLDQMPLEIAVGSVQPGGGAAGNELRRRFVHKQNGVSQFGKRVLNPAHGGGLSGTGAAGDYDFRDLFLRRRRTHQLIQGNAEGIRQPPGYIQRRKRPPFFPAGHGPAGHTQLFSQLGLGQLCFLPEPDQPRTKFLIHFGHLPIRSGGKTCGKQLFPIVYPRRAVRARGFMGENISPGGTAAIIVEKYTRIASKGG